MKWQRFHTEEPYPWEQLRFMLARLCEVVANTTVVDGKYFPYRGVENAAMAPSDFIPPSWLGVAQLPIGKKPRTAGPRRGMASRDSQAFLMELGT